MTTSPEKKLVRRFFEEVCNARQLSVADALFAPDHAYHDPQNAQAGIGPEGMKAVIAAYHTSFPDAHWNIVSMASTDDGCIVTRWTGSGTQRRALLGIAPTGKKVTIEGIWMHRLATGKIVESWNVWDTLGMLQQLGVVPPMDALQARPAAESKSRPEEQARARH